MISRTRPHRRRLRRGATLVEFALVLPVFLLVVFFFFEAWRFMQFQQAVDQAAYEAARVAIVPGATIEEARDQGRAILDSMAAPTATIEITPDPITDATEEVTVTVSLPHADVGLFFDYFTAGYEFVSTITLDHENARIGRNP